MKSLDRYRLIFFVNYFNKNKLYFLFYTLILIKYLKFLITFSVIHDDQILYLKYASNIINHNLTPYKDFFFEYPPLILFPIIISNFFNFICNDFNQENYYLGNILLYIIIDILCLYSTCYYCEKKLKMKDDDILLVKIFYTFYTFLLIEILFRRLDIFVSLVIILLFIFYDQKQKISKKFYFTIILGFFYKFVPLVIFPVAVIIKKSFLKNNFLKYFISILLSGIGIVGSISLISFILEYFFSVNPTFEVAKIHKSRSIQIESIFASIIIFLSIIYKRKYEIIEDNFGISVSSNENIIILANYLNLILIVIFLATIFFKIFLSKNKNSLNSNYLFLEGSFVVLIIFIAFQKVFSPQYLIWLIPHLSIMAVRKKSVSFFTFYAVIFFITQFIYPYAYFLLIVEKNLLVNLFLITRNILFSASAIYLAYKFLKKI